MDDESTVAIRVPLIFILHGDYMEFAGVGVRPSTVEWWVSLTLAVATAMLAIELLHIKHQSPGDKVYRTH